MSRELIRYPLIISSPQYGHFMLILRLSYTSNNSINLSRNASSPHVLILKNTAWLPPAVIAES